MDDDMLAAEEAYERDLAALGDPEMEAAEEALRRDEAAGL